MKKIILTLLLMIIPNVTLAMPMPPVDKSAHFSLSYVASDQLARHTKMTPLERAATVILIGYLKERCIDGEFSKGDFIADIAGVMFYEIKF